MCRFTMCRSALLAAALLHIAQATKAESGLAPYHGGHGRRGEMICAQRIRPLGRIVTAARAGPDGCTYAAVRF